MSSHAWPRLRQCRRLLMSSGHPLRFGCRPPALRRLTAILTGVSTRRRRDGEGARPFPGYKKNREHMLRVIRNHRRAAYGERSGYEKVATPAGAARPQALARSRTHRRAKRLGPRARARQRAWFFPHAQVSVIAPTGTIGLVMDCDTTGIEPDFALVKFQEARGGGYFKIIQPRGAGSVARAWLHAGAIAEIEAYRSATPRSARAPAINHTTLKAKASPTRRSRSSRRRCRRLRHQVRVNKWTLGEEFCVKAPALKQARSTIRGSICSRPSASPARDRGRERACLRRHDGRGCAAPEGRALRGVDCANPCGRNGKRISRSNSHIRMLAAAQPSSPARSPRPSTCPNDAPVEAARRAYLLSWKLGLKQRALPRRSKLSKPLQSQLLEDEDEDDDVTEAFIDKPQPPRVSALAERWSRMWSSALW